MRFIRVTTTENRVIYLNAAYIESFSTPSNGKEGRCLIFMHEDQGSSLFHVWETVDEVLAMIDPPTAD